MRRYPTDINYASFFIGFPKLLQLLTLQRKLFGVGYFTRELIAICWCLRHICTASTGSRSTRSEKQDDCRSLTMVSPPCYTEEEKKDFTSFRCTARTASSCRTVFLVFLSRHLPFLAEAIRRELFRLAHPVVSGINSHGLERYLAEACHFFHLCYIVSCCCCSCLTSLQVACCRPRCRQAVAFDEQAICKPSVQCL